MSFKTKKYTRPLLISELRSLQTKDFASLQTLANAISPRAGVKSAKITVLNQLTNRNLRNIVNTELFNLIGGRGVKKTLIAVLKYSV